MPEPVTLTAASLGAVALSEGIKFLYGQAGELLKRWRERKAKAESKESTSPESWTVAVEIPEVFVGNRFEAVVDLKSVDEVSDQLSNLRKELLEYVEQTIPMSASDPALLARVDALRMMLEAVYGKSLTFKGENRPQSGSPTVVGLVDAKTIADEAIGVAVGTVLEGKVMGTVRADRVEAGGKAIGVKIDKIGRS